MSDKDAELLELIKGGRGLGPGLHTYPGGLGEDEETLHEGCLELERQGLIYRAREKQGCIFWEGCGTRRKGRERNDT